MGSLSDGNDRANPSQESTPKDRSTGGYEVETVVSQRPRVRSTERRNSNNEARSNDSARGLDNTVAYPTYVLQPAGGQDFFHEPVVSEATQRWETQPGVTHAGEITTEIRDAHRPRLFDDRPRFQNVKDRPMFFPTKPEWFHLGSYDAPLVRDMRKLAPLVEWSSPPLRGLGNGGERSENLRLPRDLVYRQYIEFDDTCDTTGHKPPVETSAAVRRQQKTYVGDTYEDAPYGSVPLWTNPPAVIQIQHQETVNKDQRPHPKQSQGQFQEHLRPDDRCNDKENTDRWSWRREKTMTRDVRSWDPQSEGGTRRERSPHSSDEEDLRNVINRLGAENRPGRYKERSQTRDQSRTRESYEPYSRRTDPNEHRTRRHKYDTDLPPDRKNELAPYGQRGDDKAHKRMLRWLSEDPTRFADGQRDVARWEEY